MCTHEPWTVSLSLTSYVAQCRPLVEKVALPLSYGRAASGLLSKPGETIHLISTGGAFAAARVHMMTWSCLHLTSTLNVMLS